jgi:hypothetical protein
MNLEASRTDYGLNSLGMGSVAQTNNGLPQQGGLEDFISALAHDNSVVSSSGIHRVKCWKRRA